ncbi:hypothetical protein T484DRAFT_3613011 [Baffinella frigidus]|nr:hypothetical protein T484DRAFT_3613011 [Cryptophyta sp. CCMP2293]
MTLDEVDKVARGRVWTGKQAKDLNLVDELGGLTKAREVAGTLVGQKDGDPPLDLVPYPKEKSIAQKLAQAVTGGDQGKNTISLSADTDSFGGLVGVVRGVLQGSGMHDVAEAWSAVAKVGGVLRAARGGEAQGVQLRAETDTRL